MTRIVGHLCIYNGAQFVSSLLVPIHKYLDELIVVDGAWRVYLANGYYDTIKSTDGTKEIIEALNLECPWTWVDAPKYGWESHAEKCGEALKYLRPGDWQYYLNEDEIPIGDIKGTFKKVKVEQKASVISVPFTELSSKIKQHSRTRINRFFKYQPGIRYGYTHACLMDGKGVCFRQWIHHDIDDMEIVHLKRFRVPQMRDRTTLELNPYTDWHILGTDKTLERWLITEEYK